MKYLQFKRLMRDYIQKQHILTKLKMQEGSFQEAFKPWSRA